MPEADVDATIRALADPGRRAILDALRGRDGQSVSEVGAILPELGRHAVLKHVGVLEAAGLVTSTKVGRRRLVHLDPVPIVELAERWLDDYSRRSGLALSSLRAHLERENTMPASTRTSSDPTLATRTVRAAIVVDATPERVWTALTDPEESRRWYFGTSIRSTFEVGSSLEYVDADEVVQIRGIVLEAVEHLVLAHTFNATWSAEVAQDPESRYEWRLEPLGPSLTKVSITHSGIPLETRTDAEVEEGATLLLSGLKTLLETGHPLHLGS